MSSNTPQMSETPATPKNHFSLRRMLLCALPLLVLLLWIVALSSLARAGGTATAGSPARIAVAIPSAAKGAVAMLEVSIAVVRKPSSGQLGAVVRFKRPGGTAAEVGRVAIVGDGQSYQFDVSGALSGGGSGEVEVAVVDRGGGPAPAGAELSIGHAEIITR